MKVWNQHRKDTRIVRLDPHVRAPMPTEAEMEMMWRVRVARNAKERARLNRGAVSLQGRLAKAEGR